MNEPARAPGSGRSPTAGERRAAREEQLDAIAEGLPARAASLSRLFLTRTSLCVTRTEIGVLRRLSESPRRVTQLAADEQVTQPAVTLLVNRLQERGWVTRGADPSDGRAVLVSLTPVGAAVLAQLRAEYRSLLHDQMAALDDRQVETLASAIRILDGLIERLGQAPT